MKKTIITLIMSLLIAGSACVSALAADDIAGVKKQIADLEGKLAQLESKSASASGLAGNLSFHGYLRGRYEMSEAESSTFQSTEMAFQPRWDATDKIHGEAHLWFYPAGSLGTFYLESAMMIVDDAAIGKGSKLIVGKTRNFAYGIVPTGGNRLMSNYSLYSDSYHHDRIWGVQFLNKLESGDIDLNIALHNGYTVGSRGVGIALFSGNTAKTTAVLANRETNTGQGAASGLDTSNNKAVSMRISGKVTKNLELGLSGYTGKLSQADANGLNALITPLAATKSRHTMLGGEFRYKEGPWVWQAEYTTADIGGYKSRGGQTLVGFTVDENDSVYAQYGQVSYKQAPNANTATWDKSQVSLSWKHKLAKTAWVQVEHEFNSEDVPAGTTCTVCDNDITFIEYLVAY